jgi:hypothetical protein
MKRIVSVILILLLTTQAFSKWMIVLEFEMNKEYIAANLCENREKPVLKCGGSCQLAKQLAEEDDASKSSAYQVKFQEVVYMDDAADFHCKNISDKVNAFSTLYYISYYIEPTFSIFHPPLS